MSTVAWNPGERGQKILAVLREIDEAILRGETPDPTPWSLRYPDLASEIEGYIAHRKLATTEPATKVDEEGIPQVGERVGDYDLVERLGKGGEGMVFLARHRMTDQIVALKLVFADEEAARRIRDEGRALASLRHQSIVPVFFFGEDRGICYYTMPVMDGGSLDDHLHGLRQEPRRAVEMVALVAEAVHHAHSRGILHLDLKPANVLLDEHGQPHVSDFGLARRLQDRLPSVADGSNVDPGDAATGHAALSYPQVRGTAPYMSPEMASGQATVLTTAADVYGLGAILYTLLSGRPPFPNRGFLETLRSVLWDQPDPLRTLNPKVDRELDAICRRALHKDPSRRYGSADALANDLARWLRGEPTLAGRPTVSKHLWFWLRRNPWRMGAAAILGVGLWLTAEAGTVSAIHEANRREARRLAREVQTQLRLIEYEVQDLARDPDLRTRWTVQAPGSIEQRNALREYLARVARVCAERFGMTGGNPLVNVLLMDTQGMILADSAENTSSVGIAFPDRDYFRALMAPTRPVERDATAVSRAFRSVVDGRYKIAVSTRVWEDNRCLGLFVANVTLGSKLVLLDMAEEPENAAVVSPMDWSYSGPGAPQPAERRPYLIAFHRAYATRGATPIWPNLSRHPLLSTFESGPTLSAGSLAFRDGGITSYHRVGSTPLVVVLSRDYPWPARWVFDRQIAPYVLAGTTLCGLTIWLRRRRWRSTLRREAGGSDVVPRIRIGSVQ